jgi:hypothetical protein
VKILAIPYGPPAVKFYRFDLTADHLPLVEVLNTEALELDEEHPYPLALALGKWYEDNRPANGWDLVWTNDYRSEIGTLLEMEREHGATIVADVDDWFEEVPSGNHASIHWQGKRKRQYKTLLEKADRVLTSTPPLQGRWNGTLTPNFIEPEQWAQPQKEHDYTLIACPAGTGRAGDYLTVEAACKAALEIDDVKILFMGWFPEWAMSYPAGKVIWSRWAPLEMYPQLLRYISPDVVISPMEHHKFNEAKSNLKWLEASMVNAAFVGERWGEYQRTVQDGETGLLACGEDEWTEKLVEVCRNHQLRKRLALQAHDDVLHHWTWKSHEAAWMQGVLGNGSDHARGPDPRSRGQLSTTPS